MHESAWMVNASVEHLGLITTSTLGASEGMRKAGTSMPKSGLALYENRLTARS